MPKILLLLKLLVLAVVFSTAQMHYETSYAQVGRLLPTNGVRGITGERSPLPTVVIGRKDLKLAPGGIIFDTQNRTILHQSLPVGADVLYQLNTTGEIQRIYILTANERARLDQAKK